MSQRSGWLTGCTLTPPPSPPQSSVLTVGSLSLPVTRPRVSEACFLAVMQNARHTPPPFCRARSPCPLIRPGIHLHSPVTQVLWREPVVFLESTGCSLQFPQRAQVCVATPVSGTALVPRPQGGTGVFRGGGIGAGTLSQGGAHTSQGEGAPRPSPAQTQRIVGRHVVVLCQRRAVLVG